MKTLRLLHFADLHLGSPLGNLSPDLAERVREGQKYFLRALPGLCREQEAELLLIAGDLFDNPYPEKELADFVADALGRLTDTDVYIAPGNHDPLLPDSVWETTDWPSHVHIFTKTVQRFENEARGVCVEGSAYTDYHADQPLFVPGADAYPGFRVLLWHGDLSAGDSRYNPLDPRSPFLSDYDYVAMGHVHNPVKAEGLPAYPGFVLGRGYDETGAGGVTLAVLGGGSPETRVLEVPGLRFSVLAANVSGAESMPEILSQAEAAIEAAAGGDDPDAWLENTALRLILTGNLPETAELNPDILESRLLERNPAALSVRDHTRIAPDLRDAAEGSGLRGMMARNLLDRLEAGEPAERILRAFDLLIRAEQKGALRYED